MATYSDHIEVRRRNDGDDEIADRQTSVDDDVNSARFNRKD